MNNNVNLPPPPPPLPASMQPSSTHQPPKVAKPAQLSGHTVAPAPTSDHAVSNTSYVAKPILNASAQGNLPALSNHQVTPNTTSPLPPHLTPLSPSPAPSPASAPAPAPSPAPASSPAPAPAAPLTLQDVAHRDSSFNIKDPPAKLLKEAIDVMRQQPGAGKAQFKITSSLDEALKGPNPKFSVEPYSHEQIPGKLFYKVTVTFTLTAQDDNGNPLEASLDREFFTSSSNPNEALLGVYHVTKGIKNAVLGRMPEEDTETALDATVFNVEIARNTFGTATGVKNVRGNDARGNEVNLMTGPKSQKVRELGLDGKWKEVSKEEEHDLGKLKGERYQSRDAQLLRASLQEDGLSLTERLGRGKVDIGESARKIGRELERLSDEFEELQARFKEDRFFKFMGTKTTKEFDRFLANIHYTENQESLKALSKPMREHIQAKRELNSKFTDKDRADAAEIRRGIEKNDRDIADLKKLKTLIPKDGSQLLIKDLKAKNFLLAAEIAKELNVKQLDSNLIDHVIERREAFNAMVKQSEAALPINQHKARIKALQAQVYEEAHDMLATFNRLRDLQSQLAKGREDLNELLEAMQESGGSEVAKHYDYVGPIFEKLTENADSHKQFVQGIESRLAKLMPEEEESVPFQVGSTPDVAVS